METSEKIISESHQETGLPEWAPFEGVERSLSVCGLSPEVVSRFKAPFNEFRHQDPDSPLILPENVLPSEEWFRLLFTTTTLPGSKRTEKGNDVIIEPITDSRGLSSQINLDNIGKDFLCLIYYRQRILERKEDGLEAVIRDIMKMGTPDLSGYTNLRNSLIPVEALTDSLVLSGTELPGGTDEMMTILSDPPQRHLTLDEIPSFVSMIRNSSNLSRFIRNLSACLQDGGMWEDLTEIYREDYHLGESFSLFNDRRTTFRTTRFARETALNRELGLWDVNRGKRLPSVRIISERKDIPYLELLRILKFGDTNGAGDGFGPFEGLFLIKRGFSDRLIRKFVSDVEAHEEKII